MVTFAEKAWWCEDGGGAAAIIFDSDSNGSPESWTLSYPTYVDIPVVGTTAAIGNLILNQYSGRTGRVQKVEGDTKGGYGSFAGTSMVRMNLVSYIF